MTTTDATLRLPPALEELADLPHWVCWRRSARGGKVPLSPRTGRAASTADPDTWGTFAECAGALFPSDGVGFVLTAGLGLVALDLDHAIDVAGEILPWAREAIEACPGYWEVSPSGDGFRGLVRASLVKPRISITLESGSKLELFASGQYVTLTGKELPESSGAILDGQAGVNRILERWPKEDPSPAAKTTHAPSLVSLAGDIDDWDLGEIDVDRVIDRAFHARNGAKFRALFEYRVEELLYPSQGHEDGVDPSKARAALIESVKYWCRELYGLGEDREEVLACCREVLYRSDQPRDKWNQTRGSGSYLEREIRKVKILGDDKGGLYSTLGKLAAALSAEDLSRHRGTDGQLMIHWSVIQRGTTADRSTVWRWRKALEVAGLGMNTEGGLRLTPEGEERLVARLRGLPDTTQPQNPETAVTHHHTHTVFTCNSRRGAPDQDEPLLTKFEILSTVAVPKTWLTRQLAAKDVGHILDKVKANGDPIIGRKYVYRLSDVVALVKSRPERYARWVKSQRTRIKRSHQGAGPPAEWLTERALHQFEQRVVPV